MKKFITGFLIALLLAVPGIAGANYIGDFYKAGMDVATDTIKVIGNKNFQVGNGTPSTTLNGEDMYVEGTFEVDGAVRLDNASLRLRGIAYTLPAADGAAGTALTTNGSGTLSWSAGAAGNTLDAAYDQGGAGVGRTINATDGAVVIQSTDNDATNILEISKSPAASGAGAGISITMGANASGAGLALTNTGSGNDVTGSGSTWSVTKAGVGTFSSLLPATLTSTGVTTLGNGTATVAVNSSVWDITTAGAVSGITTLSMTDDLSLANGKAIKGSTVSGETIKIQAYDNDTGPAYVDSIVITNGNTPTIVIGSNNETIAINSSDWDISTTGDMTGIGAITSNGLFTGSLGATITGAAVNLNASSNFAVNIATGTSTGTISLGTGATAQTLDIGTGGGAKTVTLGSTNTTSTTNIDSGSGGVLLNDAVNNPVGIATNGSTGTVTIGNSAGPAVVNVLGTYTVNNDAAGMTTGIGTGTTTGTVTIGGAGAQTISVGNGAAAKTVNLGSSNTTSTTTILSGSGGVNINASNNQPTNIGTGTTTGTVTIGGAGAQQLDIGNGAAAKTVNLGSSNTTSTTTIRAGSGKINLVGELSTGDAITGDGTAALSGFLRTVTDDADGRAISVTESGSVITNAAAGGAFAYTLPAAATGLTYTFVVMAAQELRVTPAAGDAINIAGSQGDAAEYWTANAVGESLTLVAVDATNWVATAYTGTWTQQTP